MAEDQTQQSVLEYPDGTVYNGEWRMIDGKRIKHGYGKLSHARIVAKQAIRDEYVGNWNMDMMDGYGKYSYASGAIYKGEWKNNKQSGKGFYFFSDGSFYEGEWVDHKMQGRGLYVDVIGRRWEGEFVNGSFRADEQKSLQLKRIKDDKVEAVKEKVAKFMAFFIDNFALDKKKMLENSKTIFIDKNNPDVSRFFSGASIKFGDKKSDVW